MGLGKTYNNGHDIQKQIYTDPVRIIDVGLSQAYVCECDSVSIRCAFFILFCWLL